MILEIFQLIYATILPVILLIIVLISWGVTLLPIVPNGRARLNAYQIISQITSVDISDEGLAPPSSIETFLASLRTLDFQRLGERRAHWPGHDLQMDIWMMVHPQGATYAEASIAPTGQMVASIATAFENGAFLESGYRHAPRAVPLTTDKYYYEVVEGSVRDLIRHHEERVQAWGAAHGRPRGITSMDDYFEVERHYLENHSQTRLKPEVRRWVIVPLLSTVYGLLILVLGFFLVQAEIVNFGLAMVVTSVLLVPVVMVNRSVLIAPEGTW